MHLRTPGLAAAAGFVLCSPQREQRPRIRCCLFFLPAPILGDAALLFQHPVLQDEERAARKIHTRFFFFLSQLSLLLLLLDYCPLTHFLVSLLWSEGVASLRWCWWGSAFQIGLGGSSYLQADHGPEGMGTLFLWAQPPPGLSLEEATQQGWLCQPL